MQLPSLTPLQSRLLASSLATCLVVLLWICVEPHAFVYAAEIPVPALAARDSDFVESIPLALSGQPPLDVHDPKLEERSDGVYAPDFAYFDRSVVGRQADEVKLLSNSKKEDVQASPGSSQFFRFAPGRAGGNKARRTPDDSHNADDVLERDTTEDLEDADGTEDGLEKRQNGRTIWISANACSGPLPNITIVLDRPPQLTLAVSTSSNNQKPLPNTPNTITVPFVSGFANVTVQTDSEVYLGISAPKLTQGWNGSWSYEIAASDQGQYHNYANNSQFIFLVDTDSDSALFITHNFTNSNSTEEVEKWRQQNPFEMYAFPTANWSNMVGLEASYCGLKQQFDTNNLTVDRGITTLFGRGVPVGQFHVQGLKNNTNYTGFLTIAGNPNQTMNIDGIGTVRAGGQVFQQFQWKTKADDSCQVVFDLDFCSDVAYAVPSSPEFKLNNTRLKQLYDSQAQSYYQNFSNSLDQVACDTASTAQYSLARTCADCRRDYKSWLCSVLMPRCEDWTATDPWLQERNINAPFADGSFPHADNLTAEFNATRRERFAYARSRNPLIDEVIKPGPYKELLPCDDVCFDLVRSCPAQLGFGCPSSPARELSYGKRSPANLTCNFPGAVVDLSPLKAGAGALGARVGLVGLVVVLVGVWGWM